MVSIVDTTLRDGEQTPGVSFTIDEKVTIAKMLDSAGVHYIEAGTPAMGREEKTAIREIARLGLNAGIIAWNRAVEEDVEHSLDCGVRNIHISLPVSDLMIGRKLGRDRAFVLERLERVSRFVKESGATLFAGAEDASRADENFLLRYAKTAQGCGAERIRYCDTVGLLEPFTLKEKVEKVLSAVNMDVEIHTHNDFGLATANSLAGIRAGASYIDTTIMGLGERAGNAPLEEVVMALKMIMGIDTGVATNLLTGLAKYVSMAAKRPIHGAKSIVGDGVFTHESGIHVDGVMKDPRTYEPFTPEMVGGKRNIVIGKHSGRKAVASRLRALGFEEGESVSRDMLEGIRKMAVKKKGVLSDFDLLSCIFQVC